MSEEKKWPIYLFDESSDPTPLMDGVHPGEIVSMSPHTRLIELHPDRPARVISFEGIIEEPGAEAKAETAKRFVLTDEGLKPL